MLLSVNSTSPLLSDCTIEHGSHCALISALWRITHEPVRKLSVSSDNIKHKGDIVAATC